MAPHKTRSVAVKSNNIVSFSSKGEEATNVQNIICTPRYITVPELRKPAVVTDRLRRDYHDLNSFDRVSMKCVVRKILSSSAVIQIVNAYWSDDCIPLSASTNSNDDDSLVS